MTSFDGNRLGSRASSTSRNVIAPMGCLNNV